MIKKIHIIILLVIGLYFSPVSSMGGTPKFHFVGISGDPLKNIESRLQINPTDLPNHFSKEEINELNQQNIIEIKNSLGAYGYFKPEIKSKIQYNDNVWHIYYYIVPGPVLRMTALDLKITGEGINDPEFQRLLHCFPLKQGDVVRSKIYQQAKSELVNLAALRGYFAARLEKSNILIDLPKYQATIIIHFNTGPRYFLGNVEFAPSPFCDKFLYRFVPFKYGEHYNNIKIVKLQENLSNSNFFQQITVAPKPELAKNLIVPIEVCLTPRKVLQYTFGAGYGSDTGLRGLAGVQWRRLNCMGHRFEALVQASEKQNHFETSYIIPGYNPVTDYYKLSAAVEEQHLDTSGNTRNSKIEASHISTMLGWQQTLSLSLRDEHSVPTDERPIVNSAMLLPSINWSKVESDNPLNPCKGYQININIRGATKKLISNTDFIQALIQAKTLLPLSTATRLILRGQLGYTFISEVDELPIMLQFYAGGAQSVRGYKYQQIGPGRTLLVGSIELQQRIKGNLYAAIFMDAGNVNNGLISNLNKSLGIGLVWHSPVGAIEITLAQALDSPGKPRLLQFSMGPEL